MEWHYSTSYNSQHPFPQGKKKKKTRNLTMKVRRQLHNSDCIDNVLTSCIPKRLVCWPLQLTNQSLSLPPTLNVRLTTA